MSTGSTSRQKNYKNYILLVIFNSLEICYSSIYQQLTKFGNNREVNGLLYIHQNSCSLQIADPTEDETIYVRSHTSSKRKENLIYEIEQLRREMVQKVLEGQPFTSQQVVVISQTLDRKLNEYMMVQSN